MRLFNAFFFSMFFSFYGCYLFQLSYTIEFPLISLDVGIFSMWLQTCGWTDGQTDGQNDGGTDRLMGGQTNKRTAMQDICKK